MDKQGIVWLGAFHQPLHRPDDVGFRRLTHRIGLVISQDDHIFPAVSVVLVQENGHFRHIVDASSQLVCLAKVIDSDQQSLALSSAVGVLVLIMRWSAMAEALRNLRRRAWRARKGVP